MNISISGGPSGGDGMAFWYIKEKAETESPNAFGGLDSWTGLGIFFDTFDNDGNVLFALILHSIC